MTEPLARCNNCGAEYFSREAWDALPFVGVQHGGDMSLELRNCVCGSTIAVELETLLPVEERTGVVDAEFEGGKT